MKSTMTTTQAITTARQYVAVRREIRRHLIEEARRRTFPGNKLDPATQRKLFRFSSDLSDARILEVIDQFPPTRLCLKCEAELTTTDAAIGRCTQCGTKTPRSK